MAGPQPSTPLGQPKKGSITVGSEILVHLGHGIYSTPANAIKELLSNAFDADAIRVTIRAKPHLDSFVVMDDGTGMNEGEFDEHFAIVSKSFKREAGRLYSEKLKRPLIGKLGIGFLAISQLCDQITVISTKEGEPYRFEARIDFAEYRAKAEEVREYVYAVAPYELVNLPEDAERHYTIVILERLTTGFRDYLLDKSFEGVKEEFPEHYPAEKADLTGLRFEDVVARVLKGKVRDLRSSIGAYWCLMLDIANIVPVPYLDDGPVRLPEEDLDKLPEDRLKKFKEVMSAVEEMKSSVRDLRFSVDFDGIELRKPFLLPHAVSLPSGRRELTAEEIHLESFYHQEEIEGELLSFRGYFFNQRFSIAPAEFHGVNIRIKNTSIGGLDPDFLDYPKHEKLFFQQTFGEIYVDEGLEEAMNIGRASFRIGHPHYSFLQQFIHRVLTGVFKESRARYVRRVPAEPVKAAEQVSDQLGDLFERPFSIQVSARQDPRFPVELDVELDTDRAVAVVYRAHPVFAGLSANERRVRAADLILFEAAFQLDLPPSELRERFYSLLGRGHAE